MKFLVLFLALFFSAFAHAETELEAFDPGQPQLRQLTLVDWIDGGTLTLPGPLPSIIKVWKKGDPKRKPLEFGFNRDATEVSIKLPKLEGSHRGPLVLRFLTTEKTKTHPDGAVVLSALDSEVVGTKAKLETHPGNHRIGFWGKAEDFVKWDTSIPAGKYEVELVYSRASPTGTEISVSFGDAVLPHTLATTGSWYQYRTVSLGDVVIPEAGEHAVAVRVTRIVNGGVMNLKALVLTPVKKAP